MLLEAETATLLVVTTMLLVRSDRDDTASRSNLLVNISTLLEASMVRLLEVKVTSLATVATRRSEDRSMFLKAETATLLVVTVMLLVRRDRVEAELTASLSVETATLLEALTVRLLDARVKSLAMVARRRSDES